MDKENKQAGAGFTAPPSANLGPADMPKAGGQYTKKVASKVSAESVKEKVRNVKVVAIAKGWFDARRIEPGMKFTVAESEFSKVWMQKI